MTGEADGKNLDGLLQGVEILNINTKDSIGERVSAAITIFIRISQINHRTYTGIRNRRILW